MARNSAAGSKRPCSEGEDEEKAAEDAPPRKRGATTADLVGEEEKNNIPSIPYEEALARNKTPKKEKEVRVVLVALCALAIS